jgi:hypothetical protein
MMTIFSVFSNGTKKSFSNKRDATNFARKISKGSCSSVNKQNGRYDFMGKFWESESTLVANYNDGKRQ